MRPYHLIIAIIVLAQVVAALAVTLGWEASTGATGYKVYYGTSSSNYTSVVDAGNSITCRITGLSYGQKYFFALSAYNAVGESGLSESISYTPFTPEPPKLTIAPPFVTVFLEGSPILTGRWDAVTSTQMFYRSRVTIEE